MHEAKDGVFDLGINQSGRRRDTCCDADTGSLADATRYDDEEDWYYRHV